MDAVELGPAKSIAASTRWFAAGGTSGLRLGAQAMGKAQPAIVPSRLPSSAGSLSPRLHAADHVLCTGAEAELANGNLRRGRGCPPARNVALTRAAAALT